MEQRLGLPHIGRQIIWNVNMTENAEYKVDTCSSKK